MTISQGQTQYGLYCVLSHGVKEGNEWIFTQFGAGDVERLAEAALHDVALVVEEGGEAVHQAGHHQRRQAGQPEEQVTGGADILTLVT